MSNPFKAAIKAIKMEMDTDTFYNERDALWAVIHFLEAVENAKVVFYPDGQRGFEADEPIIRAALELKEEDNG